MKRRNVIFLIFIIWVIAIFLIVNKRYNENKLLDVVEKVNDINISPTGWIKVEGQMAGWTYIDREIDLDYFYGLDNTATYEQIVEDIGSPNGAMGFGLIYLYYEVDGLFVVIDFTIDSDGGLGNVISIRLCTDESRIVDIYPR